MEYIVTLTLNLTLVKTISLTHTYIVDLVDT